MALALPFSSPTGLQPVQIRRDLAQIADLVELCFADTLDAGGLSAIEDMRFLASLGPALWVVQRMDQMLKGIVQGFVWREEDYVIGNVSIFPAGRRNTWVIANVAVHPDYRGRGIAYQLCHAALKRIVEWGGETVLLQVDWENEAAQKVYYRLGFMGERAFSRWVWSRKNLPPKPHEPMPPLTYCTPYEWRQAYQLVEAARPNERGGLGWLRPTEEKLLRPSLWREFLRGFSLSAHTQYIVRGDKHPLEAVIMTELGFGSSSLQFDLMIHPAYQGQLETPLVNYLLRQAADSYRGAYTDHPRDDTYMTEALKAAGFEQKRSLIHMRWNKL